MNEALNLVAVLHNSIGHTLSSQDIRVEKQTVVENRSRHMGFGSHMDHAI